VGPTGPTGGFQQGQPIIGTGGSGNTFGAIYVGPQGPNGPVLNDQYTIPQIDPQVPGALWYSTASGTGTFVFSAGVPGAG
jgi:hypothetical protein